MQTESAPPLPPPKVCSTPAPRAGRRRRRSSGPSRARASAAKRRGRPPSNLFQEVELKYFTQLVVKPIPLGECCDDTGLMLDLTVTLAKLF